MSAHRDGRVPAARRFLGRRSADKERLAALIAAATAPARASELAGEQEVLRAYRTYREAHPAGSPAARRPSMLKLAIAKLLTVKAAAAAAAVSVVGGAALAATGAIPNPISGLGSAPPADPPPATHATPAAGERGDASPSPSLEGLCVAYLAGATDNHGKALDSPAFQALVDAAGGEEKVDEYCADLVPDAEDHRGHGKPTELPTPADLPTPTDLPTPEDLPRPKDPPTPTDLPTPPTHPGRG